MIHRLGKEINHPDSIYYWAYKNNVPVYCPALTDGSLGDMLYFHTFKNPGLILDIVADIRAMNDEAMQAPPRKTGVIILGGGKSCWTSLIAVTLMRVCIYEMLLVHKSYAVMQLYKIVHSVDLSDNELAASCDAYTNNYCQYWVQTYVV